MYEFSALNQNMDGLHLNATGFCYRNPFLFSFLIIFSCSTVYISIKTCFFHSIFDVAAVLIAISIFTSRRTKKIWRKFVKTAYWLTKFSRISKCIWPTNKWIQTMFLNGSFFFSVCCTYLFYGSIYSIRFFIVALSSLKKPHSIMRHLIQYVRIFSTLAIVFCS